MESASRQAVSEELKALGNLPSEAELGALIERYAGSRRVTCEQADLFFESIGETGPVASKPARKSGAPRDAAEVARGSWLDKLGPRSSAPPRSAAAALSIAAAPAVHQEEPITIEQALEHLPAMTYSSAPPPSALPSEDSAPVALPLSSRPAPQMTAKDSVVVERWGEAETTPEPVGERWEPAAPHAREAEEDALLDQWSEEHDRKITESGRPGTFAAAAVEADHAAVSTDAPERWSAPHLSGEAAPHVAHDDDAPLSAAELSLLDQWSAEEPAQPAAAAPEEDAAAPEENAPADTRRSSRAPRKRTVPPPIRPASLRPSAATQPPAAMAAQATDEDAEVDVELEDEIELEPDDLIEIDTD